jgi:tyrosine-protein kinase Etk/Wzc
MMTQEQPNKINSPVSLPSTEGIDFNKLRVTIWDNILWILLIFVLTNAIAYLVIRYSKDLYESVSELKLDVKNEATELGIANLTSDEPQNADVISGEIEILRSKLFLNIVLDSINLSISYYSKGDLLNHELFDNTPYLIEFKTSSGALYNTPIHFDADDDDNFTLTIGETKKEVKGTLLHPVKIEDTELVIRKNPNFQPGGEEIEFFFVINSHDVLLSYLINNLSVEPLNFYAKTIRIAFKDNNPSKARAILQVIDAVYLQYSHEQKNLANKQKIDWLNNELTLIEGKMEGFENYFKHFTLQNKTNDLDEDLKRTVDAINSIDSQRYELSRRILELNQLVDGLQSKKFFVSPGLRQILPEYIFKNLDRIQELLLEQEKLKLSYNEVTFAYRELQKEIDNNSALAMEHIKSLRSDLMKKSQEIAQRKSKLENQFINMPDQSTQYSKNERFYKLYEEFYLILMQSKSGFEIAKAGATTDFKILSPATLPQQPIAPNRLMIAGIGLVSSFTLIIFFIGFLYIINNKITNLQELEKMGGIPVLGVIPSSKLTGDLYVIDHPKSMVSEALRTLRTNLEFFLSDTTRRVIAISSTVSGEGKSFVAINLGAAIAMSQKKVILVDLDMRKVKQNVPFSITDQSKGMSTILIRRNTWDECLVNTHVEYLDYLPSGPAPPNPSELLLREEFTKLLDELKKHYDYIILDTPPVGLLTDGIQAMRQADVSIYIFRANYSKREFMLNLQRIINIHKFTNVASILNAMSAAGEQAYGYGYGYYDDEQNKGVRKIKEIFKI